MAHIDFAPDGKRWQTIKRGSLMRLWDYFIQSVDLRQQIAVNPYAHFRLRGDTGKIVGQLPRKHEYKFQTTK